MKTEHERVYTWILRLLWQQNVTKNLSEWSLLMVVQGVPVTIHSEIYVSNSEICIPVTIHSGEIYVSNYT